MIVINILDDSTLGVNLIMIQQIDNMYSALIPAESAESRQERFVANKVGSITLLV